MYYKEYIDKGIEAAREKCKDMYEDVVQMNAIVISQYDLRVMRRLRHNGIICINNRQTKELLQDSFWESFEIEINTDGNRILYKTIYGKIVSWKTRKCKIYYVDMPYVLYKRKISIGAYNDFLRYCYEDETFTKIRDKSRDASILEIPERNKKPRTTVR